MGFIDLRIKMEKKGKKVTASAGVDISSLDK